LNGAQLDNATLQNFATLQGAQLVRANLSQASLGGPSAANLSGADLAGANVAGAGLSYVNLTNATVSTSTNPTDLTLQVLTGANVTGTYFDGATLAGIVSGSLVGTPATLPSSNWQVFGGYFVGPGANDAGINLPYLSVTNGDLTGISFHAALIDFSTITNTYLTGADFSNANLTSASLYHDRNAIYANFANAVWDHTTCPDNSNSSDLGNNNSCIGHLAYP